MTSTPQVAHNQCSFNLQSADQSAWPAITANTLTDSDVSAVWLPLIIGVGVDEVKYVRTLHSAALDNS